MKIHHFTIPAKNPEHVARVLAEILGARALPMPHPHQAMIVYSGDADGTCIEVWPEAMRAGAGEHEPVARDLPIPEAWPHHGYVSSDSASAEAIVAVFSREGWKAEIVNNGPFSLVRGWIENRITIELVDRPMREEYERFFQNVLARALARQAA